MSRIVPVSKGMSAIVDDEDYDRISALKWYVKPDYGNWYAVRVVGRHTLHRKLIYMHRFILGIENSSAPSVDHINRNTLDNQKSNLRFATLSQHSQNRGIRKDNHSGYIGVSWYARSQKWKAQIQYDKKKIFIGYFDTAVEAAKQYDLKAVELFGEHASVNFKK